MIFLDKRDEAVHIMPAYWFVHNMYAMARNSWKFAKRDARKVKEQHIELDYLAPDTVQEMLSAMSRLEVLAARASGCRRGAHRRRAGRTGPRDPVR